MGSTWLDGCNHDALTQTTGEEMTPAPRDAWGKLTASAVQPVRTTSKNDHRTKQCSKRTGEANVMTSDIMLNTTGCHH
ncbi:hypothetical protein [Synechococcus sp. MIT S1220]|uniref:hypothetical protein n=1 Tax=Synechococcus sp. MIT S1220 TaxID=3082549 RepID=UPI0039B0D61D